MIFTPYPYRLQTLVLTAVSYMYQRKVLKPELFRAGGNASRHLRIYKNITGQVEPVQSQGYSNFTAELHVKSQHEAYDGRC